MIEVSTLEVLSPAVPKVYEIEFAVYERGNTVRPLDARNAHCNAHFAVGCDAA